jgi:putative peptidoglycan lipid II flippase
MQCAINYLVLFRMGYRFRLYLDWRDERLRKSGRLVTYLCLGHGASMVVEVVQNVMVSSLPSGAMSALRYATRLVESISGVLAGGTVAVTMAIVSCDIQRKEYAEMKRNLVRGIQLLMIVTLPLSLGLAMLNAPLIAALFERMRFTADSTRLVSVLLALMVPYIFFSRLVGLNQTVFFGMFDTRTPFVVTLLQSAGYLFLSLVLFQWVSVYAFPVARSLSYAAGAWSLGALIRRRFGAPEPEAGCPFVWKMMGCLAVMGLAIAGAQCAMRLLALQGIGARIGNLVVPTGVGVMALGGALLATRIARYEHLHALGKMFRLLKAER